MPIYLTAQPDDYYFYWQLELQLHNLSSLGVNSFDIHILISYNIEHGLQPHFKEFYERYKVYANIYFYPDKRKNRNYISSIRPHIIDQHFTNYPFLYNVDIFYFDSDVYFISLPDFSLFQKDKYWYISDTRAYTGVKNLVSKDKECFDLMCKSLEIEPDIVIDLDVNCGGAQYYLKKIPTSFWRSVERNSDILFNLITQFNNNKSDKANSPYGDYRLNNRGINAWFSDMWALQWTAWKNNIETRVSPELDFYWPTSLLDSSNNVSKKLLHYSSKNDIEKYYFRKARYYNFSPYFDDDINFISNKFASIYLLNHIKYVNQKLNIFKYKLSNCVFFIYIHTFSDLQIERLSIAIKFIYKHFDVKILIVESSNISKFNKNFFDFCEYHFINSNEPVGYTYLYNTFLVSYRDHSVFNYDPNYVISPVIIYRSFLFFIDSDKDRLDLNFEFKYKIDALSRSILSKVLDFEMLELNLGKFENLQMNDDLPNFFYFSFKNLNNNTYLSPIQIHSFFSQSNTPAFMI